MLTSPIAKGHDLVNSKSKCISITNFILGQYMGLNKKMTKVYQVRKKKTYIDKDPLGDLASNDSKE